MGALSLEAEQETRMSAGLLRITGFIDKHFWFGNKKLKRSLIHRQFWFDNGKLN